MATIILETKILGRLVLKVQVREKRVTQRKRLRQVDIINALYFLHISNQNKEYNKHTQRLSLSDCLGVHCGDGGASSFCQSARPCDDRPRSKYKGGLKSRHKHQKGRRKRKSPLKKKLFFVF